MMRVLIVCVWIVAGTGARAAELKVYFGSLHSHTSYSDGSGKPADAYRYARDRGKLDFLAVTEHNHDGAENGIDAGDPRRDGIMVGKTPSLYNGSQSGSVISSARSHNMDGKFVALYGLEYSTISTGNHAIVFEIGEPIPETVVPNGRYDKLLDWLATRNDSQGKPPIIQFNHPDGTYRNNATEYGMNRFGSLQNWVTQMGRHARLIEVFNGPGTKPQTNLPPDLFSSDYLEYLRLGFHLAPTGDQDNHFKNWGTMSPVRTGVVAGELTRPAILEALRERHVYATQDHNLRLIFKVQDHLCGEVTSQLPAAGSELKIECSIQDDDEPNGVYDVEVFIGYRGYQRADVHERVRLEGNDAPGTFRRIEDVPFVREGQYILFKVTQLEEHNRKDVAWIAPVWFETTDAAGTAPPPAGGPDPYAAYVASKNSKYYHTSPQCPMAKVIKEANRITGRDAVFGRQRHECPPTSN